MALVVGMVRDETAEWSSFGQGGPAGKGRDNGERVEGRRRRAGSRWGMVVAASGGLAVLAVEPRCIAAGGAARGDPAFRVVSPEGHVLAPHRYLWIRLGPCNFTMILRAAPACLDIGGFPTEAGREQSGGHHRARNEIFPRQTWIFPRRHPHQNIDPEIVTVGR